jgi:hypothetical protein
MCKIDISCKWSLSCKQGGVFSVSFTSRVWRPMQITYGAICGFYPFNVGPNCQCILSTKKTQCLKFHYYNMWSSSLCVSLDFEWPWTNYDGESGQPVNEWGPFATNIVNSLIASSPD